MKLDVFNHIIPKQIYERLLEIAPDNPALNAFKKRPELWDIDAHLRVMDDYGDYQQILSLSNPPIEMLGGPEASPALARLANDGLSALCRRYPDRFPSFIASLPMNNPDAAVKEADRAIRELDACGVQIFTNVLGKPLSRPEFFGLFELMAGHDLPLWIHPVRGPNFPDYASEQVSEDEVWFTFGWPYETSACVTRLIYSRLFDRLPTLKIITHHMGGMIPFFAEKIALGFGQIFDDAGHNPLAERVGLKKPPIEYFRMLHADTALNGSVAATRCGHAFFGSEHSLFATDAPFDWLGGRKLIGGTIEAVDALEISREERQRIYEGNARKLLRLA
jgi:predicted TIM-barrel fold metal-dependent hydrolase